MGRATEEWTMGQGQRAAKAVAYNVYVNGRLIDTVWFTGYTVEEARRSLIEHDGYNSRIVVWRRA